MRLCRAGLRGVWYGYILLKGKRGLLKLLRAKHSYINSNIIFAAQRDQYGTTTNQECTRTGISGAIEKKPGEGFFPQLGKLLGFPVLSPGFLRGGFFVRWLLWLVQASLSGQA
jgi:hypothetical protein